MVLEAVSDVSNSAVTMHTVSLKRQIMANSSGTDWSYPQTVPFEIKISTDLNEVSDTGRQDAVAP